ncbi:unnamed protein product [Adineta steineri]|uniref:Uncharacterized protein n=1 Tax=Adineta steineri TaxID=433720 RepID=A0A819QJ62_9BILA|nr:unnamed protein product [Adineta steineri]CAF4029527.1 unnamed protein product [Adineta steineri]
MSDKKMREQILHICELVNGNSFAEATEVLSSVNVEEVLCSNDLAPSLILIEQVACRLLKDCIRNVIKYDEHCLKYIEQVGLFNRRIAIADTTDSQKTGIQCQLLFDKEALEILVNIVDALKANDNLHRHDFIFVLCTWLEAVAHFVHRHDNLDTKILESLRQAILSCVLSEWYKTYLKPLSEPNIPARHFFIRSCSFVTGIFQCNQLSFENALKTAQSYRIVLDVGEKIFKHNITGFRHYFLQTKTIENDSACLTGICLLITNCYNYEEFRNDDEYFALLLRIIKSDFVRNGLLPTWTNDSTILADTLMVQLKNASNDSTIRLYLQQNHAVDAIKPYIHAEYDRLRLQTCMLFGVLLDDKMIQELKIPSDKLVQLYFDAIQRAHKSTNKCYRRVPIQMLLRALSALVHNNTIQITIAKSNDYFDYLISISDDYNIVYDIFWTLSFNEKLHEKFNSHEVFLTLLRSFVDKPEKVSDKDVARSAEGILWNLTDKNRIIALPDRVVNVDQQNTDSKQ